MKDKTVFEFAEVGLDQERCVACGSCVRVCKGGPIQLKDGRPVVVTDALFGCFGCGQCAAVCPNGCISVRGRGIVPEDITGLPPKESRASYAALHALMFSRRSVRNFDSREVSPDVIEAILRAAETAPMGIPPSAVEVVILPNRTAVKEFSDGIVGAMRQMHRSGMARSLWVFRPFMGKETYALLKEFVVPVTKEILKKKDEGQDWLLYDAPLAMVFHAPPASDPADLTIAATYAMLAAESMGLGSCLIGMAGPFLDRSQSLKKKYGIPLKNRAGLAIVFGYPAVKYQSGILRHFAGIRQVPDGLSGKKG